MRQILLAVAIALAVSILLTPALIRLFTRQGFGHQIREDGPPSHQTKRGTPSMGGVAIVAGIWAGYLGTQTEVWVAVDRTTCRKVAIKFYAHQGGLDWLILAMVQWRLGNKEEARRRYDQAIPWLEENGPNRTFSRLRAEAARDPPDRAE